MAQKKKKPVIIVIIVIAVLIILNFPFRKVSFLDGGSKGYIPLIPWYCYVEYHRLPDRIVEHDVEYADIDGSQYPQYVVGHGVMLFGMEIVFDKYEVYPDGHQEKISGFAINT